MAVVIVGCIMKITTIKAVDILYFNVVLRDLLTALHRNISIKRIDVRTGKKKAKISLLKMIGVSLGARKQSNESSCC